MLTIVFALEDFTIYVMSSAIFISIWSLRR